MSRTFTEQVCIANVTWAADTEGVHSFVPFDIPRQVNNLSTYCNNHLHFFHGAADASVSFSLSVGVSAAREAFLCQIPVKVPTWASKMPWTGGLACNSGTITAMTIYASPYPYTGVGSDNGTNTGAFDLSNLTHGYKSRSVSLALTAGNYALADDSSTGIDQPGEQTLKHNEGAFGSSIVLYVIITATTGSGSNGIDLHDFSCWFAP